MNYENEKPYQPDPEEYEEPRNSKKFKKIEDFSKEDELTPEEYAILKDLLLKEGDKMDPKERELIIEALASREEIPPEQFEGEREDDEEDSGEEAADGREPQEEDKEETVAPNGAGTHKQSFAAQEILEKVRGKLKVLHKQTRKDHRRIYPSGKHGHRHRYELPNRESIRKPSDH